MYTLVVKNKYGQELELTHNNAYAITSIEGLDPPDATINTTKNANTDGSEFNSSYLDNRQIIITMAINSPAESNRINLYRFFKSKMPVTLFYKNSSRNVYITGYVKKPTIEFFNKKQIAQIVIDCLNPYFINLKNNEETISSIVAQFEFPFAVAADGVELSTITEDPVEALNVGDDETGAKFTIHATGTIENPTLYNETTNEQMTINVTLTDGEELVINTETRNKSAIIVKPDGTTVNVVGLINPGSTWLKLVPGVNSLQLLSNGAYTLDGYVLLDFNAKFEGV